MWSYLQEFAQRLRRSRFRNVAAELRELWLTAPSFRAAFKPGTSYLAVDIEMSSLSAEEGEILSMGWVAIDGDEMVVRSARYLLVGGTGQVGESAEIHYLRDCDRESGVASQFLMEEFLDAAKGRLLLFHHASLDIAFLDKLSLQLYGAPLLLPYADTLELEKRRLLRSQPALKANDLRLASCRERYHLPDYPAHNALNDAMATAELFLALAATA